MSPGSYGWWHAKFNRPDDKKDVGFGVSSEDVAAFKSPDVETLLAAFRAQRAKIVARYESLGPDDWGRAALHPRLNQPMRIVDIAFFDSEHDDYHLGRIGELIRAAWV